MKTRKMNLNEITKAIDPIVAMRQNNWYLVSATDKSGKTNALTAAWGGLGNVCEKKVATVYIRPQRYTKRFMDESGRFTMTYFDFDKYGKALGYMGSRSGETEPDKIKNAGLTLTEIDGSPLMRKGSTSSSARHSSASNWLRRISQIRKCATRVSRTRITP